MKHSTITNLSLGGLFLGLAVGTAWALTMLPPEFHQGPDAQGRAGYAVSVAEVTGDGIADLIVGAPAYDAGAPPGAGQNTDSPEPSGPAGRVLVYTGSVGPGDAPSTILHGEAPNDRFGTAIKVADVIIDTNNVPDLIVSAMFASGHDSYRSGCIYIFQGPLPLGDLAAHDATVEVCGTQYREHFGRAIEAGDFDGDGLQDVVVGSPWYTAGHGHVEEGMHPEDGQMTGAVSLISGAAIAEHLAAPPVPEHELMVERTPGEGYLAFYGISLLNLGNLDKIQDPTTTDQKDDLMIWASGAGAGGHTRPGSAYFTSWSEVLLADGDMVGFGAPRVVITGDGTTSLGEGTPALIGDLNGDGWPEITMPGRSGPNSSFVRVDTTTAGGLYIVDGNLLDMKYMPFDHDDPHSINKLTVVSLAAITGEKLQDKFGHAAVNLGDLDGDTVPDLAVGAPWADGILLGSIISGRVYVVSGDKVLGNTPGATTNTGDPTSLAWRIETHGDQILVKDAGGDWVELAGRGNDRMGQALAAGDLTASTLPDLVVGAPDRDPTTTDTITDVPGTNSNENSGAAVIQSFQP